MICDICGKEASFMDMLSFLYFNMNLCPTCKEDKPAIEKKYRELRRTKGRKPVNIDLSL